jgi:hypothetical protein
MSNQTTLQYDPLEHRKQHIAMLMERVFQTGRWPHYHLLLEDLQELECRMANRPLPLPIPSDPPPPHAAKILSLERTLLYGGKSLFAPIFYGHDYRIREASPESAYERGPYNIDMIDDRFMEYGKPSSLSLLHECQGDSDLCLIPNALHHIRQGRYGHRELFLDCMRNLRPGGYFYIYEQFIEEIHQKPDDYVRYTPDGLASLLKATGYQIEYVRQTGNIFTSTQFLLDQILEYIEGGTAPEGVKPLDFGMTKGEDIRKINSMITQLGRMAPHYPTNGVRSYTECPKAFSVLARKPT